MPTHSFSRTKATSDIPPFIMPTKKRVIVKNSYEGENPFAIANKMSRAKPRKRETIFSHPEAKQQLMKVINYIH